ncbi:MAG: hypothetical protein SO162_04035 [Candidatus Onthomorpha sp.]|nr:hypothetical protein [Candidatus Onthomorpha sp.]
MKRIIYFFAFALILGAYGRAYAQIDSITTTCNSAIIYFDSDFDTSQVDISVFRDTLIFEENFDNFLSTQVNNSTPIGAAGSLVTIPRSLTQFPGCRAMNLKVADSGWCINGGDSATFATPKMNIPQGSIVKMKVSPDSESVRYVLINGVTDTIQEGQDTISTILQSNYDEVIIKKYNSSNITIDSLRIISPRQEIAETDRNHRGGNLEIRNLSPNTKYYIELSAKQNAVSEQRNAVSSAQKGVSATYCFSTLSKKEKVSSQIENPTSVRLDWTNSSGANPTSLSLYKIENAADDLLFSRIVSASSTFGLEIFNPTGRDICLGDYQVRCFHAGNVTAAKNYNLKYVFSSEDTIHRNDYIMLLGKIQELNNYDNVCFPTGNSNFAILGGNDGFILLKKDILGNYRDTIDVFQKLSTTTNVTTNIRKYDNTILTRKPTITNGVKHNPTSIIPTFGSQESEWNSIAFNADSLNSITFRHKLNNPVTYTLVGEGDYSLDPGTCELLLTNLVAQSKYLCILKSDSDTLATYTFSTGEIIESTTSGDWNNVWSGNTIPKECDKVVVKKGHRVSVPEGCVAKCSQLVLQEDYSTAIMDANKSELNIEGVLSFDKAEVQASFAKYTDNTNGWNLFGVPIDVRYCLRKDIGDAFQRGDNDDLYYLNEERYAWIPYFEDMEDSNFFTNSHGYLVAYHDDKTLSFKGDLFLEDSLVLLSNASFNADKGRGYHLVCNPYPFSVNLNNFTRNNVGGMWLLDPSNGGYTPADYNSVESFVVPPFSGVMTKVDSSENRLTVKKNAASQTSAKSVGRKVEALKFKLNSLGGDDELRFYFRPEATNGYDSYDTYKMFSVGSAPDLYCSADMGDLSVVALPYFEDSLHLQINLSAKSSREMSLYLYYIDDVFESVELYDKKGEKLYDFTKDSVYVLNYNVAEGVLTYDLRLKHKPSTFDKDDNEELKFVQSRNRVTITYPEIIDEVTVYDASGKEVVKTNERAFVLPNYGCFVAKVKSKGREFSTKLIGM